MKKINQKLIFSLIILINSSLLTAQCSLSISPKTYSETLLSTGIPRVDDIIEIQHRKMENLFNVRVDLNISSGANGLALKSCKKANCHGTIEIGVNLLKHQLKKTSGEWRIIAVMAHEFAHILQYKHNMRFISNVQQEIHADILAGWYIGKFLTAQDDSDKIIDDLRLYFAEMGDEAYFSPNHHGNAYTRLMAIHKGIRASHHKGLGWDYTFMKWGKEDAQYLIDKYNH